MARKAKAKIEKVELVKLYMGLDIPLGEEREQYTKLTSFDQLKEYVNKVEHFVSYYQFHRLTPHERYVLADLVWNALEVDKKFTIIGPYYTSHMIITDPLAQWPPLAEASFLRYSKEWRKVNNMEDLPVNCNFDPNYVCAHVPEPDIATKNDAYRTTASRHWWNSVRELHITLTKLKD